MKKCKHLECDEISEYHLYCDFHLRGGYLGNGEAFEQYQIIEQDFIDFIKVIPIDDKEHLSVHSPILRDIIIRCCVQIEVFFKEWAKYYCNENPDSSLFKNYSKIDNKTGKPRGGRNWNFVDYFPIKNEYLKNRFITVRPMNNDIYPFESWEDEKTPPIWWNAYNSIKHNGLNAKKDATLENALYSLGALFLLNCSNHYSVRYLNQFTGTTFENRSDYVNIRFKQITSPLDSKRYLFKDTLKSFGRPIELVTLKKLEMKLKKLKRK